MKIIPTLIREEEEDRHKYCCCLRKHFLENHFPFHLTGRAQQPQPHQSLFIINTR